MRKGLKKGKWKELLERYSSEDFEFSIERLVDPIPALLLEEEDRVLKLLRPTLNLTLDASFRPYQYGSKNPQSKHTEEEICVLLKTIISRPWGSMAQIDRELGFCKGTSAKVRAGTRYAHLKNVYPEEYSLLVSGRYQTMVLESPEGEIKEFVGSVTEISRQIGVKDAHLFSLLYDKHVSHAKGWKLVEGATYPNSLNPISNPVL
ncbi:hypothetical protein KAMAJI_01310 [Serratia phage vB_SmaM-Kamaji]|nr:hypothetical protein KAMAJI_01310 [Serratia phage vB_SmaM-Kamaji]